MINNLIKDQTKTGKNFKGLILVDIGHKNLLKNNNIIDQIIDLYILLQIELLQFKVG